MDDIRLTRANVRRTLAVPLALAITALFAVPAGAQAAARPEIGQNPVTIAVGLDPRGLALDQTAHTVYVADDNSDAVSVIGANRVLATIALPAGSGPQGVAWDSNNDTIWVANTNGTVSVINAVNNLVIKTINVDVNGANEIPNRVVVDTADHTVFVGLWLGYILAVSDVTYAVAPLYNSNSTTHIQLGGYDSQTGLLLASAWDKASVYEINRAGNIVATVSNLGAVPTEPEVDQTRGLFFTGVPAGVYGYQEGVNAAPAPFQFHTIFGAVLEPTDFAVDSATGIVYTALNNTTGANGQVDGLNEVTGVPIGAALVGVGPSAIIVDPTAGAMGTVFVANGTSNTVTEFSG
jgi:YVTN family beta-propeller protein